MNGISLEPCELCKFDSLNTLKKHLIKSKFHKKNVQLCTFIVLKKKIITLTLWHFFMMQSKMMKSDTFSSTFLKRKSDCSIINIFHVISHDKVMMKILLWAKQSVSSAYFYEKDGKFHFCMTSHSPFYKSNSCYRFLIFRYRRVKTCNCYISLFLW